MLANKALFVFINLLSCVKFYWIHDNSMLCQPIEWALKRRFPQVSIKWLLRVIKIWRDTVRNSGLLLLSKWIKLKFVILMHWWYWFFMVRRRLSTLIYYTWHYHIQLWRYTTTQAFQFLGGNLANHRQFTFLEYFYALLVSMMILFRIWMLAKLACFVWIFLFQIRGRYLRLMWVLSEHRRPLMWRVLK